MKKINPFKVIIDLLLLVIAFFSAFFLKRGNLNFDDLYISIIPVLVLSWLLSCYFTSKFRDGDGQIQQIFAV